MATAEASPVPLQQQQQQQQQRLRCSAHLERMMVEYLKTQTLQSVPVVNMATSLHDRTLHTYVFVSSAPCVHDERTDASVGASDHLCVIRAATETEQRLSWPTLSPLSPTYPLLRAFWMPIAQLSSVLFLIQHQQWASLERQHGIVVTEHDPLVWHRRNCVDVFLCFKDNLLETFRFWAQVSRPSRRGAIQVFHKDETHRWGFVCRYEMKGHPDYQGDFAFFAVRDPWRPPANSADKHHARLKTTRCECALDSNLVLERYLKSPSGVYEMCRELQSCPSGENVYVAEDKTGYACGELCASVSVEADVDGLWLGPKRSVPTWRVFVGTHAFIELFESVVLGEDPAPTLDTLSRLGLQVDANERAVYAECRRGRTLLCRVEHLAPVLLLGMACLCRVRQSSFRAVAHFMFETRTTTSEEETHRWFLFRTHESIHRGGLGRAAAHLARAYGRAGQRAGRKRQQMERLPCADLDIKRISFGRAPFQTETEREAAFSQRDFLSSLHLVSHSPQPLRRQHPPSESDEELGRPQPRRRSLRLHARTAERY